MPIPVRRGVEVLREYGALEFGCRALDYAGVWNPVWNTITSRRPVGTNVFDCEWDVLVVLDACRVDMLRELSSAFSWLDSVDTLQSVGSMSAEWMLNTFTEAYRDEIKRTALLSRNVWSHRVLVDRLHDHDNDPADRNYDRIRQGYPDWRPVTADALGHYERIESRANQDQRLHPESSSIPHIVTDRAIDVGRTLNPDRMIVWYRMPHLNFFADAVDWNPGMATDELMSGLEMTRSLRPEEKSYQPVKDGEVSQQTVRELYRQNLHLVLSYVDILLENIDAEKVMISADHGEGLGETRWGHSHGYPWAPIKTVPWAATSATDEQTYISQYDELEQTLLPEERVQLLEDMGYV